MTSFSTTFVAAAALVLFKVHQSHAVASYKDAANGLQLIRPKSVDGRSLETMVSYQTEEYRRSREHFAIPSHDDLYPTLENLTASLGLFWNTSFSVSVVAPAANASGSTMVVSAGGGIENFENNAVATNQSVFPMGSSTKSWTAMAIMRLIEQDDAPFSLSTPAYTLVDRIIPAISPDGNTTLEDLFSTAQYPTSAEYIKEVTVGQLLGMSSGLAEYNNTIFQYTTYHDLSTYTPFDILRDMNKSFVCAPGTCKCYSSAGFEILGLILAQHSGAKTWTEYGQLAGAIPETYQDLFKATYFPTSGLCSAIPECVQQYAFNATAYAGCAAGTLRECPDVFFPLYDKNCVNGWTCGNVATDTTGMATFWALMGRMQLVNDTTFAQMTKFSPLTKGWAAGEVDYGLGLMLEAYENASRQVVPSALLVGHGGQDYGSTAPVTGYNFAHNFAITFAMGSAMGMGTNCYADVARTKVGVLNPYADSLAGCTVYNYVLEAFGDDNVLVIPFVQPVYCNGHVQPVVGYQCWPPQFIEAP
eukprot:m.989836 g.989836  ORF g.989836 m.989836 type:complete len:530 (+) comp23997_c0_seq2:205-1794(+)